MSGTTTLDGRDSIVLHDIIKCDEGGWVKIDDLVRMDVLWSSSSRRITQASAGYRDRDQRLRIYNERLQLIINGNILSAKKPDGKVRLQFLGIRVKEPPAGPYTLGAAGSNMMVSRFDQVTEVQRDPDLRCNQAWLGQSDGWVRPWAVRALSGHTVHYDPEKNLMELDPHKFAISPSMSLVNQIGGAYHATSCRNLLPIVERGILPGTSIQEAQYARCDTGRLHSYFGVFPPWDARNISTKQRVSGRGNLAMPLVVLHVPVLDLVRLKGRVTDSGNIIVSRPVPFSLVKEVWFCMPKDTDRKGFDHIEKIMDGDLEDEMALEYQASPILHDFKKMKTPARLMQLLCDMPSGPHNAEKERLLRELAATIDYHHEDARRQHYLKEAANFMIKRTHPGDLVMDSVGNQVRMRLCPACYHLTPSCFSRCSICWSLFISRGKFRRQEPTREESPTEVPNANIAHSMEAAAAAVPEVGPEEDDRLDAMTVAEPEMEVDVQGSDPEPENADDLPDLDEYPEEVNDNSDDTRQAVLLSGVTLVLEPRLEIARAAMQPTVYLDTRAGNCVDANRVAFAYAAYFVCRTIYKMWPGTIKWITMPFDKMVERFRAGGRYDAMGTWPGSLSEVDPETNVSRDITDEEIRNSDATAGGELEDPDKRWLIRKFRTNQLLSMIIRGADQLGYGRQAFNPSTYVNRGQTTKEMHFCLLGLLNEVIPKVTGHTLYSLIRPATNRPTGYLYVDPVGCVLVQSIKETPAIHLGFLIDHDIQCPAKFVEKISKRKVEAEYNPQQQNKRMALQHFTPGEFLDAGQQSIMNAAVTQEERNRFSRPAQPEAAPSSSSHGDRNRNPSNVNNWMDKGKGKGKFKGKSDNEQTREREHWRRWGRDNQW